MNNHITKNPLTAWLAALLTVTGLLLSTHSARSATDLIVNGDMAAGKTGWTAVHDGSALWGSWDEVGIPPVGEQNKLTNGIWDGTDLYKIGFSGGTVTNEGVHVYQEFGAAPGALYTLACDAGVQDWFLPWGQIELIFFDAVDGVVGSNVVRFTDSLHDDFNNSTNLYDAAGGVLMQRVTNSAVAPFGTTKVRAQLSNVHGTVGPSGVTGNLGSGGNAFFDNVSLISPVVPPSIANVSPDGSLLLNTTDTLSFNASSAAGIASIVVLLNGVDVSADLVITGPPTSSDVAYTNLQPDTLYTAEISVTDSDALTSALSVTFDTLTPVFVWEAEDYNYNGGSYLTNPTPSDVLAAGSYFGLTGIEGIDFHDYSANGTTAYRAGDLMATEGTGDSTRQKFLDAGASDYNVGWFDGRSFGPYPDGIDGFDSGEWLNYTRDFPAGTYNVYGRVANGNGGTASIPLSRVTSDATLPDQTTTELGVFRFPAIGWGNYAYAPLTDEFGNLVQVTLSGIETLRVSAGSGGNLNFFMLMPVDTTQPTITGVYPDGRTLLQGTNQLTFTAGSASGSIAQSNVVVTLNGADISGSLSFSGSASSWTVNGPLELGFTNYIANISVTDDAGNSHLVTVYFDTFDPASFVVEAEDFNYDSGAGWIDNPVITSVNADNSYFDSPYDGTRIETDGVDVYLGDNPPGFTEGVWRYRALGGIRTDVCTDTPLQKLLDAQATNELAFGYNTAYLRSNSWMNYTRTYPAGDFNVYARVASDRAYSLPLAEVTGGTTNLLGSFDGNGRWWDLYDWTPLMNGGALAKVTLGGVATLRINTPEGEVNLNNFLFVPAVTLPEELQWSYAGGQLTLSWNDPVFRLQSQTNAPGVGISTSWSDYPGGDTSPVNVSVDPSDGSVFYRLTD